MILSNLFNNTCILTQIYRVRTNNNTFNGFENSNRTLTFTLCTHYITQQLLKQVTSKNVVVYLLSLIKKINTYHMTVIVGNKDIHSRREGRRLLGYRRRRINILLLHLLLQLLYNNLHYGLHNYHINTQRDLRIITD